VPKVPFVAALLFALVSVVAEAQSAARGQLIGRVVDSNGGLLPGAFVTLRPSQPSTGLPDLEAVSDDAGRFRFGDVPPGAYRVAGHLVGFQLSQSTAEVGADRDTEVSVVMVIGSIEADCLDSFPYPVRIRTRSGEPLPTAFLTVTRAGHPPVSHRVSPTGVADPCFAPVTEDRVTLDLLGYGEHVLKPAGVAPGTMAWHISIAPTRAGATGHIRGRVFDAYGASIPDASVSFQPVDPRSGLPSFEAVADARGRFDFVGVRPGTYRVTGKALGFETTVMIQEVVAGVETDMTVVVRRRP
jgi:hypothetical protein